MSDKILSWREDKDILKNNSFLKHIVEEERKALIRSNKIKEEYKQKRVMKEFMLMTGMTKEEIEVIFNEHKLANLK